MIRAAVTHPVAKRRVEMVTFKQSTAKSYVRAILNSILSQGGGLDGSGGHGCGRYGRQGR
jgi:hypothetical protein